MNKGIFHILENLLICVLKERKHTDPDLTNQHAKVCLLLTAKTGNLESVVTSTQKYKITIDQLALILNI